MWLAPLFATSGIGQTNLARYSNATFDRDLDKRARQADDPLDQRLEYQHLEDRLCRDLPLLPITFDTVSYRIDPRLAVGGNGSPIDPTTGEPRLHALYVR
jgi:ABC-type oligopeptide transport system substrate-binding subunit